MCGRSIEANDGKLAEASLSCSQQLLDWYPSINHNNKSEFTRALIALGGSFEPD